MGVSPVSPQPQETQAQIPTKHDEILSDAIRQYEITPPSHPKVTSGVGVDNLPEKGHDGVFPNTEVMTNLPPNQTVTFAVIDGRSQVGEAAIAAAAVKDQQGQSSEAIHREVDRRLREQSAKTGKEYRASLATLQVTTDGQENVQIQGAIQGDPQTFVYTGLPQQRSLDTRYNIANINDTGLSWLVTPDTLLGELYKKSKTTTGGLMTITSFTPHQAGQSQSPEIRYSMPINVTSPTVVIMGTDGMMVPPARLAFIAEQVKAQIITPQEASAQIVRESRMTEMNKITAVANKRMSPEEASTLFFPKTLTEAEYSQKDPKELRGIRKEEENKSLKILDILNKVQEGKLAPQKAHQILTDRGIIEVTSTYQDDIAVQVLRIEGPRPQRALYSEIVSDLNTQRAILPHAKTIQKAIKGTPPNKDKAINEIVSNTGIAKYVITSYVETIQRSGQPPEVFLQLAIANSELGTRTVEFEAYEAALTPEILHAIDKGAVFPGPIQNSLIDARTRLGTPGNTPATRRALAEQIRIQTIILRYLEIRAQIEADANNLTEVAELSPLLLHAYSYFVNRLPPRFRAQVLNCSHGKYLQFWGKTEKEILEMVQMEHRRNTKTRFGRPKQVVEPASGNRVDAERMLLRFGLPYGLGSINPAYLTNTWLDRINLNKLHGELSSGELDDSLTHKLSALLSQRATLLNASREFVLRGDATSARTLQSAANKLWQRIYQECLKTSDPIAGTKASPEVLKFAKRHKKVLERCKTP